MPSLGGVPLLVRTLRSLDVPGNVRRHIARRRGFDEATYVESFVVLQAVGGDCPDDFETLLGHELPSPEAARKFLYQFHDEQKVVERNSSCRWDASARYRPRGKPCAVWRR